MIAFYAIIAASFFLVFPFAYREREPAIDYIFTNDYYQMGWAWAFVALSALLFIATRRRFGATAAALVSYATLSGAYASFVWINGLQGVNAVEQLAARWHAAQALYMLLLVLIPFLGLEYSRRGLLQVGRDLGALFCVSSSLIVIWQAAVRGCPVPNSCGGTLSNQSMNACMLVVTAPMLLEADRLSRPGRALYALPVLAAILISKSSLGFGMLGVLGVLYATRLSWLWAPSAAIVALAGLAFLGRAEALSSGDRFEWWQILVGDVFGPAAPLKNLVAGVGFGTIGVLSLGIQRDHSFRTQGWWWVPHNDWLEAALALGAIGFLLMLAVYALAVRGHYLRRQGREFTSTLLYGVMMLFNFPQHVGLTALYGAWLAAAGLYRGGTDA